MSLQLHSSKF